MRMWGIDSASSARWLLTAGRVESSRPAVRDPLQPAANVGGAASTPGAIPMIEAPNYIDVSPGTRSPSLRQPRPALSSWLTEYQDLPGVQGLRTGQRDRDRCEIGVRCVPSPRYEGRCSTPRGQRRRHALDRRTLVRDHRLHGADSLHDDQLQGADVGQLRFGAPAGTVRWRPTTSSSSSSAVSREPDPGIQRLRRRERLSPGRGRRHVPEPK